MDNNKTKAGASSSSSTMNFDHLFGPKEYSSSTSSSSTGLFGSIFPPPSSVEGRGSKKQEVGSKNLGAPGSSHQSKKGESSNSRICNKNISSNYQNETVEPSYFSSSIYYGGQENYSPRSSRTTTQPHHVFKKDKDDGDNTSASRGNWWQGRSRTVLDQ
ncbi:hypothetical protein SESBI_38510 [Sesbania bispinosa]|nr:hypothetical protein SESBI_38510 [Sesbania bispinosa]